MGLKRILVALGLAAHLCTAQETWACRSFSISGASNVVLNESPACSNNWYITVLNGASVTVTSTVPVNLMRLRLQVNSGSQITFGGAPVQFTSASFGSGSGGSIYNAGDVTFNNDVSFLGNHAEDGGGIYNTPSGDMSFKGSAAFQGNSAVYGGAIFNNGGSMAFASAASFTDNSAVSGGGAIHNVNGDIAFAAEPTFDGNSAAINDDVDSNNGGVTGLPAGAGGGMSSTEIGWITALCVGAAALLCCACTWFAMRRRRRKPSPPQQAQLQQQQQGKPQPPVNATAAPVYNPGRPTAYAAAQPMYPPPAAAAQQQPAAYPAGPMDAAYLPPPGAAGQAYGRPPTVYYARPM